MQDWIPVGERLPPPGEDVRVLRLSYPDASGKRRPLYAAVYRHTGTRWEEDEWRQTVPLLPPTHWRPM